jgi:hypothetical protein
MLAIDAPRKHLDAIHRHPPEVALRGSARVVKTTPHLYTSHLWTPLDNQMHMGRRLVAALELVPGGCGHARREARERIRQHETGPAVDLLTDAQIHSILALGLLLCSSVPTSKMAMSVRVSCLLAGEICSLKHTERSLGDPWWIEFGLLRAHLHQEGAAIQMFFGCTPWLGGAT